MNFAAQPIPPQLSKNCTIGKAINPQTETPPATEAEPLIQGGLLSIFGYGVLITGPSGIGKSELALALIDRGHQLVSDDVTLIRKEGKGLVGRAPDELSGLIQLHGCGLFNVKDLLGSKCYTTSSPLEQIILLNPNIQYEQNPLKIERSQITIMDVELPQVTIPLPNQRNLALIIELLVRKEIAKK